jgi:hypothetical protein
MCAWQHMGGEYPRTNPTDWILPSEVGPGAQKSSCCGKELVEQCAGESCIAQEDSALCLAKKKGVLHAFPEWSFGLCRDLPVDQPAKDAVHRTRNLDAGGRSLT